MHEVEEQAVSVGEYTQAQLDQIKITRSLIHKGRIATRGNIFYCIKFTVPGKEKIKYEGYRLIDLKLEKALGGQKIAYMVKAQIIEKYLKEV